MKRRIRKLKTAYEGAISQFVDLFKGRRLLSVGGTFDSYLFGDLGREYDSTFEGGGE